jgi:A/G-specific adenine glycosylase
MRKTSRSFPPAKPGSEQAARLFFVGQLLRWYGRSARSLPWRRTRDPYRILVSELMLQQTQVDRVLPKYREFLRQFPTVAALAAAPQSAVVTAWQGLGYNRRALYLQAAARQIVDQWHGRFPRTIHDLEALPGVGPYTARAVASFAYDAPEAVLDTNVARVVGRYFLGFRRAQTTRQSELWKLAQSLITPSGSPRPGQRPRRATQSPSAQHRLNQALMDFGSLVCTARRPACQHCPLQTHCQSYPAILTAAPEELRLIKRSKEKQHFGQPKRIWRGKILKFLHDAPNQPITGQRLARSLNPANPPGWYDFVWEVITGLQTDGFVVRTGQRVRLRD